MTSAISGGLLMTSRGAQLGAPWWYNPLANNIAQREEGRLGPMPVIGARPGGIPTDLITYVIAIYGSQSGGGVSIF